MDGELLVKSDDVSNPEYGCKPEDRPIEEYIRKGVVNIDKPAGPTSHEISAWVKQMFNFKKVGHSGTLDPNVTGVLPTALEEGTKVLQALLLSGKEYVCLMKLHGDVSNNKVKKTLSYFQAELYQRPPLISAVKRQLRKRTVYKNQYLEREGDYVLFQSDVQAGTYIRKLCHDMGLVLGVGAHMQELRRVRAGPYHEDTIVSLHTLRDALEIYKSKGDETKLRQVIQPMESAMDNLPKIWVKDTAVSALCHGAKLNIPGVSKLTPDVQNKKHVALFTLKGELIALANAEINADGIINLKKGVVASCERVMIPADTYPKTW